jgi:hypothetical protein
MPIDKHHRPSDGATQPTLCAYHASKLKPGVPRPDPAVVAAELLNGIHEFVTADEVNLFLGNLIKQFAHKRIARRDAIALAYMSQLLLTSVRARQQEQQAELEAEGDSSLLDAFVRSASRTEQPSNALGTHATAENDATAGAILSKAS